MTKTEFNIKMQEFMPTDVANEFCAKLEIYKIELQEWNRKFNLTRLDSEEKIYDEYFFNSLSPYLQIEINEKTNFLDIGSGSGIPGILIALFYKKAKVTIIESNLKKCNFMRHIITLLNIVNIKIINERAEIFANETNNIETYDYITSRAFAKLKIFIEISFPLLKINGFLIAPKSEKYQQEIEDAKWIMRTFGCGILSSNVIESFNIKIYNVVIQKIKSCPQDFPREWKEIIN